MEENYYYLAVENTITDTVYTATERVVHCTERRFHEICAELCGKLAEKRPYLMLKTKQIVGQELKFMLTGRL